MNTKHLLLATITATFVALNFTSCKEEGMSIEEKIQHCKNISHYELSGHNIKNNVEIRTDEKELFVERTSISWLDVADELHFELYIGDSDDNMELNKTNNIRLEYFNGYRVKLVEYLMDGTKRYDVDSVFFIIYCLPERIFYDLEWGNGGVGQSANSLKIKPFYINNNDTVFLKKHFSAKINLSFNESCYGETYSYNKDFIIPFSSDSLYIEPKEDLPSYVKKRQIGHNIENLSSNSESEKYIGVYILVAPQYDVFIKEFKLFIMNDTITYHAGSDLFKQKTSGIGLLYDGTEWTCCSCFFSSLYNISKNIFIGSNKYLNNHRENDVIGGYHFITDSDWLDIEESFGIKRRELTTYFLFKDGRTDITDKLLKGNSSTICLDSICAIMEGDQTNIAGEITTLFESDYAYSMGDTENVCYLYASQTTTVINNVEYVACRLFMPYYNRGVLRCLIPLSGQKMPSSYTISKSTNIVVKDK